MAKGEEEVMGCLDQVDVDGVASETLDAFLVVGKRTVQSHAGGVAGEQYLKRGGMNPQQDRHRIHLGLRQPAFDPKSPQELAQVIGGDLW